jgi:paraquat-inducible protein B
MDKGKSVESRREFYGLETPLTLIGDVHGSQFTIEAADLGSLDIGSPIYYRRVQVGRVASYHLREDGAGIILKVFIDAPYDRLVTSETRFWNVSGIDLSVGADGVRLKTQTVATILAGGIAFASTAHGNPQRNGENIRYTLASDEASALAQPDGPAISFRLRFERSLRGLVIGAPVQFSSVVIGRVTSINLDYNPAGYRFLQSLKLTSIHPVLVRFWQSYPIQRKPMTRNRSRRFLSAILSLRACVPRLFPQFADGTAFYYIRFYTRCSESPF